MLADEDYAKGQINQDDLNLDQNYNKETAYNQSKLANILFTRKLANQLKDTGVTVNAVHPGQSDTGIRRHLWYYTGITG